MYKEDYFQMIRKTAKVEKKQGCRIHPFIYGDGSDSQ